MSGPGPEESSSASTEESSSASTEERDLEADRPIPDLLDHGGRLRRFAIAAAIATVAAVLLGTVTYGLAREDLEGGRGYVSSGAWRFVAFFTGAAWAVTYVGTRWWLERRQRREGLLPGATARAPRRRR